MSKTKIATVGLIGLCGGVVVLGTTTAAEQTGVTASQGVQREAVRTMTAACPELFAGNKRRTWVTMVSIPGQPGQEGSGTFTLKTEGKKKPIGSVTKLGGTTEVTDFPSQSTHAVATAIDGLAPGSVAARSSEDKVGGGRGLSSAECTQPSSKVWLVGGGTETGQRDRLILVNPTDSDAIVDLDIYGSDGQVDATGTDGIAVKARDREEVQLDAVVPGVEALAVRVKTKVGLISGFIADERMEDLTPRGTEIIAHAGSPLKRSVVAGIPGGEGERQIVLFAPRSGGNFRLRALTAKGPVELEEGQDIEIRQGRVRVLDLTEELKGRAAAIEVVGDVPLLAAANLRTQESELNASAGKKAVADAEAELEKSEGAVAKARATQRLSEVKATNADAGSDIVWFSARSRLPHTGVATALLPQAEAKVSVVALDGDVDVRVSVMGNKQKPGKMDVQHEITVAADTSRELKLKSGSKSTYSVVVERVDGVGKLHASHHQTGPGRAITGYSLSRLSPRAVVSDAEAVYGPPN